MAPTASPPSHVIPPRMEPEEVSPRPTVSPRAPISPRSNYDAHASASTGKVSPRAALQMGGLLQCNYPSLWRAQGGLAKELARVLDGIREDLARGPSLDPVESLCQNYDLGSELQRFRMRVQEVERAKESRLPRDLLRGLFDTVSEAAWWLLQSYSREELREVSSKAVDAMKEEGSSEQRDQEEEEEEEEDGNANNTPASAAAYIEQGISVLEVLEKRCMERILSLSAKMAATKEIEGYFAGLGQGKGASTALLRELELGANDPTTRELGTRLWRALESAFDQYTGLRQVNDFRGLPEAPFSLPDAVQLVGRIHDQALVVALQALENVELCGEGLLASAFEEMCISLVDEYRAFKDGILVQLGYTSSLRELDKNGRNMNSLLVLDYVKDVMAVCDTCVEQMSTQFNERVQQIEFLAPQKQAELFASMGGRQELARKVRAILFQVKPWARESIQVQTQALLQREVFGKSRDEIMAVLKQSKNSMLAGFEALVEGRVPEPMQRLSEIIAHIDALMEPILAKKPSALRRGKTGKLSGKKKRGNGTETSLAFSGMTIRGNQFKTDASQEFSNLLGKE